MITRNIIKALFYRRKSFFDPTKNYSHHPSKLINKFSEQKILNVGAGKEKLGESVITLDKYEKVNITGDAISLPIKAKSFHLALSIAVLEHLKEPQTAVNELHRILKKNGEVYIEIPFIQPFHSSPHDYYRATLPGLKHWCREFKEIDSGVCVGPGSAVAWLNIEYSRLLFGEITIFGIFIELIVRLGLLPLKYLDKFLIKKDKAQISASAIYFHGKKV